MSGPEVLVEARGAAFGYRGAPVVSGVDLEVRAGARVGILGPNGAGKSTLLRGLLGLVPLLSGSLRWAPGAEVGYVPQREALDPVYPLSVEEVVRMGAYGRLRGLRRLPARERARALQCLEDVQLADKRRAFFAELSGGQRQRALIARALLAEPRVLVLDEPTTGVDRPTRELILELLSRKNEREGLAVLLVSHEFGLTRRFVSEVLWVDGGRILHGLPDELLSADRLEELLEGRRG